MGRGKYTSIQRNTSWILHIKAKDPQETIHIAKNNPEFDYVPSATIEIRRIKTKEVETGFVYPTNLQDNSFNNISANTGIQFH